MSGSNPEDHTVDDKLRGSPRHWRLVVEEEPLDWAAEYELPPPVVLPPAPRRDDPPEQKPEE
jgi:hypothetical protein